MGSERESKTDEQRAFQIACVVVSTGQTKLSSALFVSSSDHSVGSGGSNWRGKSEKVDESASSSG